MKIVTDSNVLFTFFWKDSAFDKISIKQELELFSPEHALEEINKYSGEIQFKAGLSKNEFNKLKKEIKILVEFIPIQKYQQFLKEAKLLAKYIREDKRPEFLEDLDFIALALKLKCPIWSNDKLLKEQPRVKILDTKDIILIMKD
ncbi:hypothetical protein HYX18_04545 [Candidatus Woesearchaeota archaeon]|nr:hypothetical protein [Candidatus Woesearchaeota archaeon]